MPLGSRGRAIKLMREQRPSLQLFVLIGFITITLLDGNMDFFFVVCLFVFNLLLFFFLGGFSSSSAIPEVVPLDSNNFGTPLSIMRSTHQAHVESNSLSTVGTV